MYQYVLFALSCLAAITMIRAVSPTFDRPTENVTVIIGSSATLPCFISNLGDHKVAWIKVGNTDIIAIGDYKVTNDDRIKLVHGYVSDWSLSIQQVNEEDAGEYICQVNTEPLSISRIFLQVLLPPKIVEEKSTITPEPIVEYDTLKLYCHADGIPSPKVSWYFRKRATAAGHNHHAAAAAAAASNSDHNNVSTRQVHSQSAHHHHHAAAAAAGQALMQPGDQVIHEGSTLVIRNASRHQSGIYECIANNSVQPAASRKIKVSVEFPPEIHVQSEKVEQLLGLDARFECRIKANPLVNHYWMRNGNVIENTPLDTTVGGGADQSGSGHQHHHKARSHNHNHQQQHQSNKYEIIIYNQNNNEFLTVNVLIVKNITKADFGLYQCFAVNSLNTSQAQVELKEIVLRRTSATKTSASKILFYSNTHKDLNSPASAINEPDDEHYRGQATTRLTVGLSKQSSKRNQTANSKLLGHLVGNELSGKSAAAAAAGDDESLLDPNENSLYLHNAAAVAASKRGPPCLFAALYMMLVASAYIFLATAV